MIISATWTESWVEWRQCTWWSVRGGCEFAGGASDLVQQRNCSSEADCAYSATSSAWVDHAGCVVGGIDTSDGAQCAWESHFVVYFTMDSCVHSEQADKSRIVGVEEVVAPEKLAYFWSAQWRLAAYKATPSRLGDLLLGQRETQRSVQVYSVDSSWVW